MSKRPVKTQMTGPVPSAKGAPGVYDHNSHAPFGRPHDLGGGGIPCKFEESMPTSQAKRVGIEKANRKR